jgi:hypothetical protein
MTRVEQLEKELDEIYESLVGDNGRERYTHRELIDYILDIISEDKESNHD